jgi:hypothetical protein
MGKRGGILRGTGGTKMFPVQNAGNARMRGSDAQGVYAKRGGRREERDGNGFSMDKNINGNYILFMHAKEKKTENPGCKSKK